MSGRSKTNPNDSAGSLSYEVDQTAESQDGRKPPAVAATEAAADDDSERPASSLLGAERDLRAKQNARSQIAGAWSARPSSNSRLMRMEEDALSKARGARGTSVPSVPGAVASSPPPAGLQSLEADLETKNRTFSGRSVVNPSVAAATAAARRAAQEHAASSKEEMYQNETGHRAMESSVPSAQVTRPSSATTNSEQAPPPMMRDLDAQSTWTTNDEESAVVSVVAHNQTAVAPLVASSVPNTAPAPPLAAFQSVGSYDEATAVDDVNPIEAFVAGGNVVDAAGVAVVMDEEEEKKMEAKKLRKYLILVGIGFVIVILAIVIPTAVLLGGDDHKHEVVPTMAPSQVPSMAPSFAPTAVYFTKLQSELAPYSGSDVLLNRTSPQFAAAQWMTTVQSDVEALDSDVRLQLYALAVFYFALDGDNWRSCGRQQSSCAENSNSPGTNNWLKNADYCSWYVIVCENKAVTDIRFSTPNAAGLVGSLPYELFLITSLKALFINTESVSGTIPKAIQKLTNLETLILTENELTGSIPGQAFSQLTKLQSLFLQFNKLNGTIPSTLGLLPLNDLRVSENNLTGTIPTELGSLSSLGNFFCGGNSNTGTLPTQLFSLKNLTAIVVFRNEKLKGTIPSNIAAMTNAGVLSFGNTSMSGTLPEELFGLTKLTNLIMSNAAFSGTLSPSFGNLNQTMELDLSYNKFRGAIPSSFVLLNHLNKLYLQGNDLTGSIVTSWCNRTGYYGFQEATVDCGKVSCACCGCP